MLFHADLHIHSKYSMATSRDCDLERLVLFAAKKGIAVAGTGDFTHPAWFAEISEKLTPAEPGLYRLKPEFEREARADLPPLLAETRVRFMLSAEISTIYKKDGKTRKVHHILLAPGLDAARRMGEALGRIGNVCSDGRPILGLDSRDLFEICLSAGEDCVLIPAHVWTPWFSALGSKSGFDSIEECYGDLAGRVFALETGLSSDPAMNHLVSRLDRFRLVSNSDAHSPAKLGREATVFDTDLDYFAMMNALRTGEGYAGTVEFFPEEGKYHLDGHRKCGVRVDPAKTPEGPCPVCGKPLTAGVLRRVMELRDRESGAPPATAGDFQRLVPLREVIGDAMGRGPNTKGVGAVWERLVSKVGPELFVLKDADLEDVAREGSERLAEGIERMRQGRVLIDGGYDGEYGKIRLFDE